VKNGGDGIPQGCCRSLFRKPFLKPLFRNGMVVTGFRNEDAVRVGYARVSTVDQNPELQMVALRTAGCERVFVEKASGAKGDRREFARMLGDVLRDGDTLVVWKLDCLARSLAKLIATADELRGRRIGLVSLTEAIDTTTPGGLLGAIAQFERALIRERTVAGLVEARRRGKKGGRPRAMSAADVVAARALMRDGSLPVRRIAERMKVSVGTLYRSVGRRDAVEGA